MKSLKLLISLVLLVPLSGFGQNVITLSGIISDSLTTKTLEGIDVTVKNIKTGTITLYDGSYILYLNEGIYDISFSAKGYLKKEMRIDLTANEILSVELVPAESKGFKFSSILLNQKLAKIPTIISYN